MFLKVVLQGNLGHFSSEMYTSAKEFLELRRLVDECEVAIAGAFAIIGKEHWPEIEAILCNFWCPGYDLEGETVKHFRTDKVLEASVCINCEKFHSCANETRCNALFFRALTLAAVGFRKYKHEGGAAIEAIRDSYFSKPSEDDDF